MRDRRPGGAARGARRRPTGSAPWWPRSAGCCCGRAASGSTSTPSRTWGRSSSWRRSPGPARTWRASTTRSRGSATRSGSATPRCVEGSYADAVLGGRPGPRAAWRWRATPSGHAYAPYSNFPVGAAIRTTDGRRFAGANVENAAYPQGQCAEASAIGALVAGGGGQIAEVVVASPSEELCTPCGGCRQRLREFAPLDAPIHLVDDDRVRRTTSLAELLPLLVRPGAPRRMTAAAHEIAERAPGIRPRLGLMLGSGLGALADGLEDRVEIPYARPRRLPPRQRRRPRRRARAGPARRAGRGDLRRPLARLRADRGRRDHHAGADAQGARRRAAGADQRGGLAALRGRAGQPRRAVRPHQPARLQPAHRPERRQRRAALPQPRAGLRPGAAGAPARRRRRARHRAARRRLPRGRRARASRPRRRSAPSARWAPTSSG